jgi:23S rRNA (adenine2503-C2)-methyltransferase
MNNQEKHAQQLALLLQGLHANLNIIPINSHLNSKYKRPELIYVKKFAGLLQQQGINVVIREEKGSDIEAACGQLAGKVR